MAEQFKNLASTTLNGAIDDEVTTITVASAMGFTGGNFRILVDSEIMKVAAVSGLDLTVARGQEGTSPTAHDNAAAVRHVLTVGALDAHDQDDLAAYDAYASKPAAGVPGRIFLPTDGIFFERDNGSIWEKFGPLWPMTPPQASDFPTWVNQGTASIADSKGAVWLYAPYTSNLQIRARVKDYPAPPFTVEAAFIPNVFPNTGGGAGGIGIRDSSSGKLQLYGVTSALGRSRRCGKRRRASPARADTLPESALPHRRTVAGREPSSWLRSSSARQAGSAKARRTFESAEAVPRHAGAARPSGSPRRAGVR